ncbi:MAG: hypothetical protein LBV00_01815 [Propionibacteriaceae bacterium]|nr:hypothetical protein [Propionibacteriaceae bacterium]
MRTLFKTGATSSKPEQVWSFIKATQPVHEGTHIPRSFELDLGNGTTIWVSGNATKHLQDIARRVPVFDTQSVAEQVMLLSLREAVKQATMDGVPQPEEILHVSGWRLKFAPPRESGQLPSLIHARHDEPDEY